MRDESYLNLAYHSCKCNIGLSLPPLSSFHGRLDPSAERKVARDGISAERERIECLRFASRPSGREREIRTPRDPKQAPLRSRSLSLSHSPRAATRESEIGRRIEINAPMSKSALARSAIFLPVDINVPYLCRRRQKSPLSLLSFIFRLELFQSSLLGKPSQE